ncbi:hypothetical protein ACLOJK_021884 [Asimina triloba]
MAAGDRSAACRGDLAGAGRDDADRTVLVDGRGRLALATAQTETDTTRTNKPLMGWPGAGAIGRRADRSGACRRTDRESSRSVQKEKRKARSTWGDDAVRGGDDSGAGSAAGDGRIC